MRRIERLGSGLCGGAAFETALSRVVLEAVACGARPETLRVWRADDALAFSVADRRRRGIERAIQVARDSGFEPILRLAGGHAAVYTHQSLAFAWTLPVPDSRLGISERFEDLAVRVVAALRQLGVDARLGEVAGEYCPGAYSVNARGRAKLMGVGQRIVSGAAHVGGVIVVGGSDRARGVLEPVYQALDLAFEPETVGSVADEVGELEVDAVLRALLDQFERDHTLSEVPMEQELVARARRIEEAHRLNPG